MKKTLSLILIILMMISINNYAASDQEQQAGENLKKLGLLAGYPDGSLGLDKNITRAEVATLALRLVNPYNTEIKADKKSFPDLADKHWASSFVSDAYHLGIITGYPDGTFMPNKNISLGEVITIIVSSTKNNENLVGTWPENFINKAKELGIIDKDDKRDASKIITRGEMSVIIYNSLFVKKGNAKNE